MSDQEKRWTAVGEAIAARVFDLGLTKAEMHRRTDITPKTLVRYMAGEPIVRLDKKRALCLGLGWTPDSIDRLLRGEQPLIAVSPMDDTEDGRAAWRRVGDAVRSRIDSLDATVVDVAAEASLPVPVLAALVDHGQPIADYRRRRRLSRALGWTGDSISRLLTSDEPMLIADWTSNSGDRNAVVRHLEGRPLDRADDLRALHQLDHNELMASYALAGEVEALRDVIAGGSRITALEEAVLALLRAQGIDPSRFGMELPRFQIIDPAVRNDDSPILVERPAPYSARRLADEGADPADVGEVEDDDQSPPGSPATMGLRVLQGEKIAADLEPGAVLDDVGEADDGGGGPPAEQDDV